MYLTCTLNGQPFSGPGTGSWSAQDDRHTADIVFDRDGDYSVTVTYTDPAGNALSDTVQAQFTVDRTPPKIRITGAADHSANKEAVMPAVTVTDLNPDPGELSVTLKGAKQGVVDAGPVVSRARGDGIITVSFRNFDDPADDIYTLTVAAADRAGNEALRSITFSVNRKGSNYILSEASRKQIETGFIREPPELVIEEINVDLLEAAQLVCSRDGVIIPLREGVDYSVQMQGSDGTWKRYIYTVRAGCFREEGAYTVQVYSRDRAQNAMTNRVRGMDIEFVVDRTPPRISVSDLEDQGRYPASVHEFTVSVKDDTVLSAVELYVDGACVRRYEGEALEDCGGLLAMALEGKNEARTVRIMAWDAAGNQTSSPVYEVLVTDSRWVRFFMNRPLFLGSIAGSVIFLGAALLLTAAAVRRRRKRPGQS